MVKRGAVVLAGGKSKRFQVKGKPWMDKALARIHGKPLLIHVIEGLMPVVEEIIICVNSERRKITYAKVLRDFSIKGGSIKIVRDLKNYSISGPAVAIATGLSFSNADYCIVVPCDTPFIQPTVIDYLFNAIKDASIAVPIHADGSIETIMFTCEREKTLEVSETLCWLGRDRPDDLLRSLPKVKFVSSVSDLKDLDPEFKSFININYQEDLIELQARVVLEGPMKESICIDLGSPEKDELKKIQEAAKEYLEKRFIEAVNISSALSDLFEKEKLYFWAGLCREKEGSALKEILRREESTQLRDELRRRSEYAFMKAAQNYALEAILFTQKQISLLAERAKEDESWCIKHGTKVALKKKACGDRLL